MVRLWNEQRSLTVRRALRELLYPTLAKEAREAATLAANTTLTQECASRLREVALAPPYRIAPAKKNFPGAEQLAPKKKKRQQQQWVPNFGDYYERRARVVGACLIPDAEADRSGGKKASGSEVVLCAVDESGELLDRMRCKWLLTSIRARGSGGGGASQLDVLEKERKLMSSGSSRSSSPASGARRLRWVRATSRARRSARSSTTWPLRWRSANADPNA